MKETRIQKFNILRIFHLFWKLQCLKLVGLHESFVYVYSYVLVPVFIMHDFDVLKKILIKFVFGCLYVVLIIILLHVSFRVVIKLFFEILMAVTDQEYFGDSEGNYSSGILSI